MIKILNTQGNTGYELMHGDYDVLAKLQDNCTNGDMIRAMFPDCKDWKATIVDTDEEVYEVHFVQLPNSITVNKYEERWWNASYLI